MEIRTRRLRLVPATAETTRMETQTGSHDALGRELNAIIPANWPPENVRDALEFFAADLEARGGGDGWRAWYWLAAFDFDSNGAGQRILVGSGGFKGLPENGTVEIGYGTLDEFQGRGVATEAVEGLIVWAFSQPEIRRVTAEAAADNPASVRVLEKCGFVSVGVGSEPGHRLFERGK